MEPTDQLPVVVYDSNSLLRKPRVLLKQMGQDLVTSRELAWRFFMRNVSARYRQSILGPVWTFLPPLVTAATFTFLRASGAVSFGETEIPYPFYVLLGTVTWQLFADSIQMPISALRRVQTLMKTIKMPIEALILAATMEMLLDKVVQVLILIVLFLLFQIPMQASIIFFPVALLLILFLGAGLGLLLIPIGGLYTDISSALPLVIRFWFFLTPVIYPPPEKFPYSVLSDFNPVSPLLIGARDLVIHGSLTQPLAFTLTAILSIVLISMGWVVYRLAVPILIERF